MRMAILQLVTILIVARLLWFLRDVLIRALARRSIRWTFVTANRFALITTEESRGATPEKVVGGNVVDVLHSVTGQTLVRDGDDLMNWHFEPGMDPDHDNYFFRKLGVQDMGNIFYKKMTVMDKRNRYALDQGGAGMSTQLKKHEQTDVFFTGEVEVPIEEADTADGIGIDIKANFIFERKFPYRSVMRVAEEATFLATMVEEIVNNETSSKPVRAYYGGDNTKANREELARIIETNLKANTAAGAEARKKIEDQLGLVITEVAIHDVDLKPANKALLAKKVTATMEAEASGIAVEQEAKNIVTLATANAEAKNKNTEADKKRNEEVLFPLAEKPGAAALFETDRKAAAYENNKHVTTWVNGGQPVVAVGK